MKMFNFLKKENKKIDLSKLPEIPALPPLPSLPANNSTFRFKDTSMDFSKLPKLPSMASIDIPEIRAPRQQAKEPQLPRMKEFGTGMPVEIEKPEEKKMPLHRIIRKPMDFFSKAKKFEQQAEKIEEHELQEIHEHAAHKPVYVEGNIFKQVLTSATMMSSELKENFDALEKVKDIERRKSAKFENFKSSIVSVQRKFILMDRILFK